MVSSKVSRGFVIVFSASEIALILVATARLSEVIDQISRGSASLAETMPKVVIYGLCVYLSTVCNIGVSLWTGLEKVKCLGRAWQAHLPRKVSAQQRGLWERFFTSVWDQTPRSGELELGILSLSGQVVVVYAMLAVRAFSQARYELLAISLPLLALNLLANRVKLKAWHEEIHSNQKAKSNFLGWHQRYFALGLQTHRAWRLERASQFQENWLLEQLKPVITRMLHLWEIQWKRLFFKSLLCDFPFYLGVCFFLYLGIQGSISVGSIFFWLTMNELLFRANSNLRIILDRRAELQGLKKTLTEELKEFPTFSSVQSPFINRPQAIVKNSTYEIKLQNGQMAQLNSGLGVQRIIAGNGSGKTHLMRALAGEKLEIAGSALQLKESWSELTSTWIDSEFEILGFQTAREEILGPRAKLSLREWLSTSGLSEPLQKAWRDCLERLLSLYPESRDLPRASKGEKALFTFARALTFIEMAELILVDEVDGPLAPEFRQLVNRTLEELGQSARVLVVSHHQGHTHKSWSQKGHLLGYDLRRDLGHVVPFVVRATESDGASERKAIGNVAEALLPILDLALELLSATDADFSSLKKLSFTLQCHLPSARVKGIDSAGLGMVLALINLKRQRLGQIPFAKVAATGHIDLTGDVHRVAGLERKREAAQRAKISYVLSPEEIHHVEHLERYLLNSTRSALLA